jgi:hypothetical protein
MADISTLVDDIYEYLAKEGMPDVQISILAREKQDTPTLRLSQMGPRCPRALWYSIHHPELAEPLPPQALIKYAYGHMIEALAIELAKKAGHTVTGEQDELVVDGIKGHRDCVIDGCVVDVKSTSSLSFNKFKDGTLKDSDDFGYLDQLDGYVVGSLDDPLVTVKDRAYILAVDKQLGKMALYEHHVRQASIIERIAEYKRIVGQPEAPECTCGTVPDGESGNTKLDTRASYSPFKYTCFPNLRTFLYANGPRFLTHVERRPYDPKKKQFITEVDRLGQIVYHN